MGKALVLGGCGYLGDRLVDQLVAAGHDVVVYDSLLFESEYLKSNVHFVFGDIRDTAKLKKYLKWADAVAFLAAHVGDGACTVNPEETLKVNRECVRYVHNNFDGRILAASSASVYGAQNGILTEKSAVDPLSLYAFSKVEIEKILIDNNCILYRLGTLFGLSGTYSRIRLDLFLNKIVMDSFYHKKINVYGKTQYRPFLHVKDAADQMAKTLFSNQFGIYNLHYQNIQLLDAAHQVRGHFNDVEINVQDIPTGDLRNYRIDSSLARNLLGFKPKYTLDDGINEVKMLFDQGRIKDPFSSRYHNHNFFKEHPEYLAFSETESKPDLKEELKNLRLTSIV